MKAPNHWANKLTKFLNLRTPVWSQVVGVDASSQVVAGIVVHKETGKQEVAIVMDNMKRQLWWTQSGHCGVHEKRAQSAAIVVLSTLIVAHNTLNIPGGNRG